jgi:hypothetical protein
MTDDDARFADGADRPLRLRALDADDLQVISTFCQDAVLTASDMKLARRARRFALLLNRFRWERGGTTPERVRAMLVIEDVLRVQVAGAQPAPDTVLSLLSISWEPGADGTGRLILTLAGDGAVALSVEALDVVLRDVTLPYAAPSGQAPHHPA